MSTEVLVAGVPATAQQHAVESLRSMIVSGALRPAQRVNQDQVAESVGLSVAPVREALRVLEQEGQVTYRPRRGYFVTELHAEDLKEIYELRQVLEALERISLAAKDCYDAAAADDVIGELEANRRFHFAILASPDQPHTMRHIRLLWESTEAYRAMYYNSPEERRRSIDAHDQIMAAMHDGDAERLVAELDAHRERALAVLCGILSQDDKARD
jgi:DNA-binding GntR family transcriptional regulator